MNPEASPQEKLAAIEAELTEVWPTWRAGIDPKALHALPMPYQARLKWLFTRRGLLLTTTAGVSTPRDWPVRIISLEKGPQSGRPCVLAQPVTPDLGGVAYSPELLAGPPKVDRVMVAATESPSQLAVRIAVPLETVEAMLPHVPPGEDAAAWILGQVRAVKRAARQRVAP